MQPDQFGLTEKSATFNVMLLRLRIDHILFWVFTVFFHAYTRLGLIPQAGWEQFVLEVLVRNGLLAGAVYVTLGYTVPEVSKHRLKAILALGIAILCYVILKTTHDIYLYEFTLGDTSAGRWDRAFYNFSIVLFYLAFATTLYLSREWYVQREKMRLLEMERLQTELQYLRAQINPHFLFNSINTIYFQIDKQNSVARETLEKFSDMLRYQLYECGDATIAIEKEIHYLNNYIQLQKLRLNESHTVQFNVDSTLANFSIAPLLLVPFIENAFKHVSHNAGKPNEIQVIISRAEVHLHLRVYNTVESPQLQQQGGIGLKNVTRRLDLIYGDRYRLDIQSHSDHFMVNLEIPIQ